MVSVTETTREGIEKVINNLGWILYFWNEKMHNISVEGKMDRAEFLKAKDIGIKFMETFVIPTAESYEWKLKEFKIEEPKVKDEEAPSTATSNPLEDGFLNGVPSKRIGRPPGSKNKEKSEKVPVPASLVPGPVPEVATAVPYGGTTPTASAPTVTVYPTDSKPRFYRKGKPTHKESLTLAQRDQITKRWVENKGVMTDANCSSLATEMGFSEPGKVKGWVTYLTKVVNNDKDFAGRAKGWTWMIGKGMISSQPVPVFFTDKIEVAFTSKPKAVV